MSFQNIPVQKFKELMDDENTVVLDVRTPEEEVEGMVPGAVVINIMDASFPTKVDELDKDKTYLVYCRSGGRSATACKHMSSTGFDKLYNLEGGIKAWNKVSE
ncbi:rhodanese-like domain-containing protein [Fulvivirga sp. M361]|uniref:rhodanese-like domain-containing protein n=1 Tax=Fulvivirga sp. M361 TaxID=2594266 RepID=UPI00117AFB25|nr:rhodanese-like domain-containing protein [Fulvivirga sp. M361]TRX55941.1 rhodanese-like domain-containing protein [Fulvivirga sp. M361]